VTQWEWDAGQARVLEHPGGPLLVLGAGGTGKTTVLVELLARRLREGLPPALALCLTRQAASEVRDRVIRSAGRTSLQPQATTVHAFCLALLQRYGDPEAPPPRLLTAPEQEFRVREVLAGRGASAWPAELAEAVGTRGFARQVRAALARARQVGLDPADVAAAGAAAGEPAWVALGGFFEEYLDVLDAEGVLDYAELVHRARLLLERADVRASVASEHAAVYVDEFSELDPAQLGLLAALSGRGGEVVAFADPDASIYRFRGAHPRAVAVFESLFGGETATLGVQHRCPEAVAAAARGVAARLGAPPVAPALVGAYRAAAPAPAASGRGRVEALTFPDEASQAERIAAELRAAHLEVGTPWADMAVLVRAGREQIPPLARALTDAGIPVEVAGDEIGLAEELAVRPLLLALDLAAREGGADAEEAARLLTSGWGGLDAVALRVLGRALRAAAGGAVGVPSGELIAAALNGGPVPEADASEAGEPLPPAAAPLATLAGRRDALAAARSAVAAGRRPEEVLWLLWTATPWPEQLRAAALGGGDAAQRAHRDLDAVVALFALARDSQAPAGEGGVRAFLAEVAAQQIPADLEREAAVRGRGVRLLTAHRAKGRQWPLVVVAGVQEGVWPDVRRRGALFDPERLAGDGLTGPARAGDLVATERRLFLLAVTRASHRLLVTAIAGTEGEADQPSRFLSELGVPARHELTPPIALHTLRALVASLRAATLDPAASPELRSAAAARLARLAAAADDDGRPLVPDADPARWWGLRPPTGTTAGRPDGRIVLSPSQLAAVLACPRQYFLAREARAEPPAGSAQILGQVIHALAERALTEGLTRQDALDHLDAVWDRLPFPARWFSHSERAAAEQAVVRFMGWQEAHEGVAVLGAEVPFEADVAVEGGRVTIRGTVDRLELGADGRVRVIDFKSGRTAPTVAKAAASEQLGVYQLAVEAGAFAHLAPGASSGGGALVYLRHGTDDYPKEFHQPSLTEAPHLSDDPEERAHPTWVHHRVARARRVLAEGRFDATPGEGCQFCAFQGSCPARSGQVIA